jgi:hypothetical protein
MGDGLHDLVERAGGEALEHALAFVVVADTNDDVGTSLPLGDELVNDLGWMLEIGIHDDGCIAPGLRNASGYGGLFAKVAR